MPNSFRLINDFFESPLTFIVIALFILGLAYSYFYLNAKLEKILRENRKLDRNKMKNKLKIGSNISFFMSVLSLLLPEFPRLRVVDVSPNIIIFMLFVAMGIFFRCLKNTVTNIKL